MDAWLSYKRKIWNDRIDWRIQLNVKNLFGGTGLRRLKVQPWGQTASVSMPAEKRWYVTNTFEF
jgi:hypothetical protein